MQRTTRMNETTTRVERPDGTVLSLYAWTPSGTPKASVHMAHGLAEHARRYARLGAALVEAGYALYAHDQRGHGQSVASAEGLGVFGADGWNAMVADLVAVHELVRAAHPDVPLVARGASATRIMVGSRTMFEAMNRALELRQVHPVIDRVFEFGEATDAYRFLESQQHFGKVVIRV